MGVSLNQLQNTVIKIKKYIDEKTPNIATSSDVGVVKPDNTTIEIKTGGILSAIFPTANTNTLGFVQPDNTTIKINSAGIISVPKASNTVEGVLKYDNVKLSKNASGELTVVDQEISHFNIKDTGTYTHLSIDEHIKNMDIHSVTSVGRLDIKKSVFEQSSLNHLVINKSGELELEKDDLNKCYYNNGEMISPIYDTQIDNCEMRYCFHNGEYDYTKAVISIYVRTGSTLAFNTNTWSSWVQISTTDSKVLSPNNRYIQIKVNMSTSDQDTTPKLESLTFYYGMDTTTVIRDAFGDFPSLADRLNYIDEHYKISNIDDNMAEYIEESKSNGIYVSPEIYIGDNIQSNKYALFLDTQDMSSGTSASQVNWNETDVSSPAFILNKPKIPSIDGLATEKYVQDLVNDTKITISKSDGNMIQDTYDGIFVAKQTLEMEISSIADNLLTIKDDGLYVPNINNKIMISKETGNIIQNKLDGLYATSSEIYTDKEFQNMVDIAIIELNS